MAQYTRMNWQGRRLWTERGVRQAEAGLELALQHLLTEARKIVPLEEGPLDRSGRVDRDGLEGAVSFNTAYAVVQHERLDFRHAPGRSAKYLEIPFVNERDVMLRLMAVPIISWLH